MNYKNKSKLAVVALIGALVFVSCSRQSSSSDVADLSFMFLPRSEATAETTAPVIGTDEENAIADQYIVVFKKGVSVKTVSRAISKHLGNKSRVLFEYTSALHGFAAVLTSAEVNALRNDSEVAYIAADRVVQLEAVESWGLDRLDQRDLPLNNSYTNGLGNNGAGVHAYILDTGINSSHVEFTGRLSNGKDTIDNDLDPEDCHGHGTHVAGTVGGTTFGVANGVTFHGVRVLNCQGSGTSSQVIAGIDWVRADHLAGSNQKSVANMSLSGGTYQPENDAVASAFAAGVVFAVAAGNDTVDACTRSPASEPSALTVGATDSSDVIAYFSNFGTCVDLFAPGVSIKSAHTGSPTATDTKNGTSMASPHVAGVAALFLADGSLPAVVPGMIIADATACKLPDPKGSPNLLLSAIGDGFGGDPGTCGGGGSYEFIENGSLAATGSEGFHPTITGGYYYAISGNHVGHLEGPGSADFDLYLSKWQGNAWVQVASSLSASSIEDINYAGSTGYYSWSVKSYSGSGSYTMSWNEP